MGLTRKSSSVKLSRSLPNSLLHRWDVGVILVDNPFCREKSKLYSSRRTSPHQRQCIYSTPLGLAPGRQDFQKKAPRAFQQYSDSEDLSVLAIFFVNVWLRSYALQISSFVVGCHAPDQTGTLLARVWSEFPTPFFWTKHGRHLPPPFWGPNGDPLLMTNRNSFSPRCRDQYLVVQMNQDTAFLY